MRRNLALLVVWAIWAVCSAPAIRAEGVRPSETYLPNTTVGFLSAAHPEAVVEQFRKTQVGQLVADPVMEPFIKDIQRQFEDRIANIKDHLSVTIEDLKGVAGGEVALAAVRPAPGVAAVALTADVTGKVDKAKELLAKITANLTAEGAKKTEHSLGDVKVLIFELPQPAGADMDEEGEEKGPAKPRQAVYCLVGDLLMASDRLDIIEGMLSRVVKPQNDSLADHPAFKYVIARCATDAKDAKPHLRWYVQPLGYIDVLRASTPEHRRRKGKNIVTVLQDQGFAALQGAGGFLTLADEGAEILHRTAVYAPRPWEKSMKLLALRNAEDFAPQAWVPREIATYATVYFDIVAAFDNFGPLYGEVSGLNDEKAWAEAVEGLAIDTTGPRVHLRNDLCAYLGPRITIISDYQVPITPNSERLLFAIETSNEKSVAKAIEKLMKAEEGVKRREIDGLVVWEMTPPTDDAGQEIPVVSLPTIGGPGLELPGEAPKPEEEEQQVKLLPHAAVTVAHGHLFCASHIDFLIKVLNTAKQPQPLQRDPAYQAVEEMINSFEFKSMCARTFSFTDEEVRPTYELIRMNKLPESETMLARAINTFSPDAKRGQIRKAKIDGRELPEYDVVRRHLGPAGMAAACEDEGWFIKGCLLKKQ